MSYDLYLLKPRNNETVDEVVKRALFDDVDEINPEVPNEKIEEHKRLLAARLIQENPKLQIFQFNYQELAKLEGITEAEARVKYRHLELNGAEGGNGTQVTIYDDSASITIPYWHKGEQARHAFTEIWNYLRIFQQEAAYLTVDPQLEKALDLSTDFQAVLQMYGSGVEFTEQIKANYAAKARNPWWKFW